MADKGRRHPKGKAKANVICFQSALIAAGITPCSGKEAVEGVYRAKIVADKGWRFTGSVDTDAHFKSTEPQSHRWDYGIGISFSNCPEIARWVEPHPASSTAEVVKMLAKLAWLKTKLETAAFTHLRTMTYAKAHRRTPFHWLLITGGECRILANNKEARMLVQQGLRMPTRQVTLP